MGEYWNLERLTEEWTARGLSRRDLMRLRRRRRGHERVADLDGRVRGPSVRAGCAVLSPVGR